MRSSIHNVPFIRKCQLENLKGQYPFGRSTYLWEDNIKLDVKYRRKTSVLQDCWGLGVGLTTPPRLKHIVTKSEEVKSGRSAGDENAKKVALNGDEWAKLLKKARAHQGLPSQ